VVRLRTWEVRVLKPDLLCVYGAGRIEFPSASTEFHLRRKTKTNNTYLLQSSPMISVFSQVDIVLAKTIPPHVILGENMSQE
jgi:hypothetical protein